MIKLMGRPRQTNCHLPRRMHLKHGQYWYVTSAPTRKWIPLGADEKEARKQWARLENGDVSAAFGTVLTMKQIFDRYARDVLPTKAEITQINQGRMLRMLQDVFGKMAPDSITSTHIGEYLDRRGRDAPAAANLETSLLSHIFTKAVRWGFAKTNPCTGVERHQQKVRDRYITDAEYATVFQSASFPVQIAMDLAYYTGQRLSDVLKMKWSDIQDGCLMVVQQKTKARLSIEVGPEMQTVIDRAKQNGKLRSLYIVSNSHGHPYSPGGFETNFYRARIKAGIKDFHFHDIRGKAATDLEDMHIHIREIQSLLGHKTQAQTENYIKSKRMTKAKSLSRIVDNIVDIKKNGSGDNT